MMMSETENKKKHIAMYIGSIGNGGAEHVICNLAEFFFDEGKDTTIIYN